MRGRLGVGAWLITCACAGGAGDDAAAPDSGSTPTDPAPGPAFLGLESDCSDGDLCFWTAEVDGSAGSVDLYLVQAVEPPWSEHHWIFTDLQDGRFALTLSLVADPADYVENQTTLLDMTTVGGSVSWLLFVKDAAGAVSDCATGGADPAHWEATCPA